eukprot:c13336_g1_i1.p1 GENE.c13336_g1_i1~~c13336_g1_i1.p1  ORF type:complete len:322 (-),score=97.73 c13336_g1_i1:739-1572(-)
MSQQSTRASSRLSVRRNAVADCDCDCTRAQLALWMFAQNQHNNKQQKQTSMVTATRSRVRRNAISIASDDITPTTSILKLSLCDTPNRNTTRRHIMACSNVSINTDNNNSNNNSPQQAMLLQGPFVADPATPDTPGDASWVVPVLAASSSMFGVLPLFGAGFVKSDEVAAPQKALVFLLVPIVMMFAKLIEGRKLAMWAIALCVISLMIFQIIAVVTLNRKLNFRDINLTGLKWPALATADDDDDDGQGVGKKAQEHQQQQSHRHHKHDHQHKEEVK